MGPWGPEPPIEQAVPPPGSTAIGIERFLRDSLG